MLTCGIVILNYKDYETTEELISRIKDCPEIEHIVIVDNDSPNDSYTRLKKYESAKISVIQSGRNGGYSFGNNVGARYLIENYHVDIIGIANPDTEFDGAFVGKIKQVFADCPDYAVLTGLAVDPNNNSIGDNFRYYEEATPCKLIWLQFYGAFLARFMTMFNVPPLHYKKHKAIIHSPDEVNQVWEVRGCLFFIRREDFEAAGLFDENVFMHYEEHILAFKLRRWLRRKAGIVNTLQFIHNHRYPETAIGRLNYYVHSIKMQYDSRIYYFNHYVTGNKFLQWIHIFLLKTSYLKVCIGYRVKRLYLPAESIFHVRIYFTHSNASL